MNLFRKNKHHGRPGLPLLNETTNKTRYAESYRTLRTNIQFSLVEENFRTLLVTSAGVGEGKTTTAANLAYTISQAGRSILAIDADLRRPTLSTIYDTPGDDTPESIGLTGLLAKVFSKRISELDPLSSSLFDVLHLLRFQKRTGRLLVQDHSDQVELFFQDGLLVDLNWLTRPAEKKLAAVLKENEYLAPDRVELAVRRQQDTGSRLGFVIASMGLMNEAELKGILTIHVMEVLNKVVAMKAALYTFTDMPLGEVDSGTAGLVDLKELLGRSVAGREEMPLIDGFIRQEVRRVDDSYYLLPTGPIPPNPTEILGSARMDFLFDRLKKMFDVLVVDSPPLLPASDALVLAPRMDGVLLVVKPGFLNRELVARAVDQLRIAKANLLGVVLNQVDTKREGYYKYYHKYYARYYGDKS
ncbi:MAG: CpsD/CapB family tyrosine-protein kinase [Desulfobacterales bacterium]|nr:CpsD/CapB family tyrosine-protein kinase [Desulfobacterales bacterium]